ncbi:MAG: pentapeptide repeat-containing protein [Planctomycetes bacterium]|nr:pentapeptide repeat-containing protein [Planctomycetota bacterium]
MEEQKCRWKPKYASFFYKCQELALPNDWFCILHSQAIGKDIGKFTEKVMERVKAGGIMGINVVGACFFDFDFLHLVHTFKETVNFSEAIFSKDANFGGVTFSKGANFEYSLFWEEAHFSGAKFLQCANFRGTTFDKNATFSKDFTETSFKAEAIFSQAKFFGDAIFDNAAFDKKAYFDLTKFHKEAYFLEAIFSEGAEFGPGVLFKGNTYFEEATFGGITDFWGTFEQDVKFSKVKFLKANFSGTDFCGIVEFSESRFEGDSDFTGVIFKETSRNVEFKDVVFHKEANFSASYWLHTEFDFTGTIFRGRTFFTPRLPSDTTTQSMEVGSVMFNTVSFLGECIFQGIDLSNVSFLHSNIDKVDFRYCKFNEKPEKLFFVFPHRRQNVLRDELDADKEIEGKSKDEKYEPVRRLYLELKRNFEDKKDWNTAGDFHYGEMECRRKGRLGGWQDFFLVTAYCWASGYGERLLNALVTLILLFFGFSLGYMLAEGACWGQAMWKSIIVASLGKVEAPGIASFWGKVLWLVELILFPLQIALFALALRRKVKR